MRKLTHRLLILFFALVIITLTKSSSVISANSYRDEAIENLQMTEVEDIERSYDEADQILASLESIALTGISMGTPDRYINPSFLAENLYISHPHEMEILNYLDYFVQYYPFAVGRMDLGEYALFNSIETLYPNSICLYPVNKQISFFYPTGNEEINSTDYRIYFDTIDTINIRVFSWDTPGEVRNIKVNSIVMPYEVINGDHYEYLYSPMYLFYNRNGGISIAVPNFSNTVDEDLQNVMFEYVIQ